MESRLRDPRLDRLSIALLAASLLYTWVAQFRDVRHLVASTPDDSAYYLEVARNYVNGFGWTFDRLHRTNGFHPLWQYFLVAVCAVARISPGDQMRLIAWFEAAALAAAGAMLWRLMRDTKGSAPALFGTVLFTAMILFPLRQGMESSLLLLLSVLLLAVLARPFPIPSARSSLGVGVLLGMIALSRLDSVFFIGTMLLVVVLVAPIVPVGLGTRWGRALIAGLVAALMVAPYLAYNQLSFGHLVPISGAIKSSFPVPGWRFPAMISRLDQALFILAAAAAVVYLAGGFGRRRGDDSPFWRYGVTGLAAGTLIHQVYSLLFMKWAVSNWHFALSRLLLCILIPAAMQSLLKRLAPARAGVVWALACWMVLAPTGWLVYRRDWGKVVRNSWRGAAYDLAIWAEDRLPRDAVLANSDCGYIGLFCRRPVVNLDGVINGFEYQTALKEGRFVQYLQESGVTHFVAGIPEGLPAYRGEYDAYRYTGYSHLYDVEGGSLDLPRANEIYRSPPFGESRKAVLVIWRVPWVNARDTTQTAAAGRQGPHAARAGFGLGPAIPQRAITVSATSITSAATTNQPHSSRP